LKGFFATMADRKEAFESGEIMISLLLGF